MAHIEQVRLVFEEPERYLNTSRYNIRIRSETVGEFVRGRNYERILDIGCGDGSISVPLLCEHNRLTIIDISRAMLSVARSGIPAGLIQNVEFVNDDFLTASMAGRYDLILCLGVLGHFATPALAVAKIASLLEKGGCAIAQVTDCHHPVSWVSRAYGKVRNFVTPTPYSVTLLSARELFEMFASQGMELIGLYRYSSLLPGMGRLLSEGSLYSLIRLLHGRYPCNRNAALGNEFLCQFRRSI